MDLNFLFSLRKKRIPPRGAHESPRDTDIIPSSKSPSTQGTSRTGVHWGSPFAKKDLWIRCAGGGTLLEQKGVIHEKR